MHYLTIRRAKQLMRDLQELGNFDEFRDDREPDGLNTECAEIIADAMENNCKEFD